MIAKTKTNDTRSIVSIYGEIFDQWEKALGRLSWPTQGTVALAHDLELPNYRATVWGSSYGIGSNQYLPDTVAISFAGAYVEPKSNSVPKLLEGVTEQLSTETNIEVAKRSSNFVLVIQKILTVFAYQGIDLSKLPKWYASHLDDGAIAIEWIFKNFRLSFTIEADDKDSAWYLTSTKQYGDINASGYLSVANPYMFIKGLMTFVLELAQV